MTNKSMKPSLRQAQPTSPEELYQLRLRAYLQQRTATAQAFINCVLQNPNVNPTRDTPTEIVKFGVEMADAFLKESLGVERPEKPSDTQAS